MSAWDAITVETVASATRAHSPGPGATIEKNGVLAVAGSRSLSEVAEDERRLHEHAPRCTEGRASEVPHVRIQRLASGDGEHHRAEHQESLGAVLDEEGRGIRWRERAQHRRVLRDLSRPQEADGEKPQHHHRSEPPAEGAGAAALDREEADQDHHRDGNHGRCAHARREYHQTRALRRRALEHTRAGMQNASSPARHRAVSHDAATFERWIRAARAVLPKPTCPPRDVKRAPVCCSQVRFWSARRPARRRPARRSASPGRAIWRRTFGLR